MASLLVCLEYAVHRQWTEMVIIPYKKQGALLGAGLCQKCAGVDQVGLALFFINTLIMFLRVQFAVAALS